MLVGRAHHQQLARGAHRPLLAPRGQCGHQAAAGAVSEVPVVEDHGVEVVAGQREPGLAAGLGEAQPPGVGLQRRWRRAQLGQQARQLGRDPRRQARRVGLRRGPQQGAQCGGERGVGGLVVPRAGAHQQVRAPGVDQVQGQARLADAGRPFDQQHMALGPAGGKTLLLAAAAGQWQRGRKLGGQQVRQGRGRPR